MILTVTFSGLTQVGAKKSLGNIHWNDQKKDLPEASNDSAILAGVLRDPINVDGEFISVSDDPRTFMRNLAFSYRSPYLYASKAVNS